MSFRSRVTFLAKYGFLNCLLGNKSTVRCVRLSSSALKPKYLSTKLFNPSNSTEPYETTESPVWRLTVPGRPDRAGARQMHTEYARRARPRPPGLSRTLLGKRFAIMTWGFQSWSSTIAGKRIANYTHVSTCAWPCIVCIILQFD